MIPAILQQEDVIACAKTGSGKTYAFLIPIISQLKSKSLEVGIRSLILVPTRELALQTATVVKQLIKFSNLQYSLIIGGHDYTGQFESLACNPDIVIATPGRLLELMLST
jgi:ATP-dependent RNA helicase DDX54/DBP10